jgi:hypothetical protein
MSNELDPLQKGCRNGLLTIFTIGSGLVSLFGLFALLTTFVISPELQTMPDQYGYVRPAIEKLILYLAITVAPLMFLSWIRGKLNG